MISTEEAVAKIKAAVDARTDPDLLVLARTDACATQGFEAAVERAQKFAEAGANILLVEAVETVAQIATLPRRLATPQLMNMVIGGKTPIQGTDDLARLGYGLVLYANAVLQGAVAGMPKALGVLRDTRRIDEDPALVVPFSERQRLVGKPAWMRWRNATGHDRLGRSGRQMRCDTDANCDSRPRSGGLAARVRDTSSVPKTDRPRRARIAASTSLQPGIRGSPTQGRTTGADAIQRGTVMAPFKLLIDGRLVDGDSTMDVINPADESVLVQAPRASLAQAEAAVQAAHKAYASWRQVQIGERRAMIFKLADEIKAHAEDLARLLTQEQGKPLAESTAEIVYTEYWLRYLGGLELPMKVVEDSESRRVELHRHPLGVVAAIVPWNFPVLIIAFKLPLALLAGNTLVIKPAPTTPLTALRLGELCAKVFPPGVVNVIADANDLGPVLTSHPLVAKVTMTGSTATGKKVMASAAGTLKRLTLELGGNDAAIVLDDADPKKVAPGIFGSAFLCAGQLCLAVKRVYAHERIYDELVAELAKLADAAVVGDGLKEGVQFGPLQNAAQYGKFKEYLADAREHGRIAAGGTLPDGPGFFVRPTIVADIEDGTRLVDEEQFSLILPIIKYRDIDDAVASANSLDFGLGASAWSASTERAVEVAKRMEAGTRWVNKHADFGPSIPFCGAKQSGLGVEFAEEGLNEFTQIQVLNIAK